MYQHDFSVSPVQQNHIVAVSRCDRWQVHQRLTELDIHATCSANGTLEVEIHSPTTLVQLRSVLTQFIASRQQRIDWLDQCWQKSSEWR